VIVCFVDLGGIDDHYCLNFLFIISFTHFLTISLLDSFYVIQVNLTIEALLQQLVSIADGNQC
jgi:hypothetical protein